MTQAPSIPPAPPTPEDASAATYRRAMRRYNALSVLSLALLAVSLVTAFMPDRSLSTVLLVAGIVAYVMALPSRRAVLALRKARALARAPPEK